MYELSVELGKDCTIVTFIIALHVDTDNRRRDWVWKDNPDTSILV